MFLYYLTLAALLIGLPLLLASSLSLHRSTVFLIGLSILFFCVNFWGSFISLPLSPNISVSASKLALACFILISLLFLLIENDVEALRNIIRIVCLMTVLKFSLLFLLTYSDQFEATATFFQFPTNILSIFSSSTVFSCFIIVISLLSILAIFKVIHSRISNPLFRSLCYTVAFGVVLSLYTLIFSIILSISTVNMLALSSSHTQENLILISYISFALFIFILSSRGKLDSFHAQPFTLKNIFFASAAEKQLNAKTSYASLKQSKVMYQELAESIKDIFFCLDKDLCITYWNKAAEASGISQNEAIGKSILDVCENADKTTQEYYYRQVINTQKEIDFISECRNKHGELRYRNIKAYPSQSGVSVLATDISEQLKNEKEQTKLEAQLHHAQKIDSLGTLAGGIAHDFNNILAVIQGYIELCQAEVADSSSLQSNLKHVYKASERAEELVKQILSFSRTSESNMNFITPSLIIKEAVSFLNVIIGPKTIIKTSFYNEEVKIQANPNQLHQALINLGTNAFHAIESNGGGVLEFSTKTIELSDSPLAQDLIPTSPIKQCLQISIKDDGIGIAPEEKARILDPFYTTKKSREGTGLGLSIVDRIITRHHGKIVIDSHLGQGTCISLYFPLSPSQKSSPPQSQH